MIIGSPDKIKTLAPNGLVSSLLLIGALMISLVFVFEPYRVDSQNAISTFTSDDRNLFYIVNPDGSTDTIQVNSSSYQASPAIYEVGIVSPNAQASAAIQTAIANNDLATVQAVINGSYGSTTTPETSAPETSAPETSAPETSAPETSAPTQDPSGDMDDNVLPDPGQDVTVIQ